MVRQVEEDESGAPFSLEKALHQARSIAFDNGAGKKVFLILLEKGGEFCALRESLVVRECEQEGDEGPDDEGWFL